MHLKQLQPEDLALAEQVFTISGLSGNQDSIELLGRVFSNPLCRVIFEARRRCFSDYSEPTEVIDASFVIHLIQRLNEFSDEESRVKYFFDQFVDFRPQPLTQKYMLDEPIDLYEEIKFALKQYVESIKTEADYQKAQEKILRQRMDKTDRSLFDVVKYTVAASIESKDLYSRRNYHDLMSEVFEQWDASAHVVFVKAELERLPIHQKTLMNGLRRASTFPVSASVSSDSDVKPLELSLR